MMKVVISDEEYDKLFTETDEGYSVKPGLIIACHYESYIQFIVHYRDSVQNNWVEYKDGTIRDFNK